MITAMESDTLFQNLPSNPLFPIARGVLKTVAILDSEFYLVYTSVLRRTLTSASPAAVAYSGQGYGLIWTTAEVTSFEGIAPAGWFASQLDTNAQWLKSKPRICATAGQKVQVMYDYTE
jgi:hypothetical protein